MVPAGRRRRSELLVVFVGPHNYKTENVPFFIWVSVLRLMGMTDRETFGDPEYCTGSRSELA